MDASGRASDFERLFVMLAERILLETMKRGTEMEKVKLKEQVCSRGADNSGGAAAHLRGWRSSSP